MRNFNSLRIILEDLASDFSRIEATISSILGSGQFFETKNDKKTIEYKIVRDSFLATQGNRRGHEKSSPEEYHEAFNSFYWNISKKTGLRYETEKANILLKDITATFFDRKGTKICKFVPYYRNSLGGRFFILKIEKYFEGSATPQRGIGGGFPRRQKASFGINDLRAKRDESPFVFARILIQESEDDDDTPILQIAVDEQEYESYEEATEILEANRKNAEWFSGKSYDVPYHVVVISNHSRISRGEALNIKIVSIDLPKGLAAARRARPKPPRKPAEPT